MSTGGELSVRERRRARGYFWSWIILATLLSIAGNTAHAAWTPEQLDTPWFRVAVGAVPPVMLALGAEGVSQLYRVGGHVTAPKANGKRPWIWWCAVVGVAALAVAAFALSYSALMTVASIVHYPATLAAAYPLVLDLSIAVGLLALVALPPVRHDVWSASPLGVPQPDTAAAGQDAQQRASLGAVVVRPSPAARTSGDGVLRLPRPADGAARRPAATAAPAAPVSATPAAPAAPAAAAPTAPAAPAAAAPTAPAAEPAAASAVAASNGSRDAAASSTAADQDAPAPAVAPAVAPARTAAARPGVSATNGKPDGGDADAVAQRLLAANVTRQPHHVVVQVVRALQGGTSINAAATDAGISHHAARRISEAM